GLFGALSIMLTIVSNRVLIIQFIPPVNYLMFDLGEIPVMVCFLMMGPRAGVTAGVVEWLALNLQPTSVPLIGPLFKLLSVLSTLVGVWIGWRLLRSRKMKPKFAGSSVISAVTRSVLMTGPNALFLIIYFHISPTSGLYFFLELTALFNVLQIPFDLIPTFIIISLTQVKHTFRSNGMTWFESRVESRAK
ncbi:MAG: ECF transporter S component, partial [Nitrososphaerales archaeon]